MWRFSSMIGDGSSLTRETKASKTTSNKFEIGLSAGRELRKPLANLDMDSI